MKIISVVSLGLAAVLAFSACGDAKEAKGVPLFLSPADYDPSRLLPPPPADNSPENQMELAELHAVQQSRTPADMMRAKHDGETENATIFEETIGSGFTLAKFPATAKLMAEVQHDEKAAVATAKTYFLRSRPWVVDPTLAACSRSDKPKSSYPSGHTTMSFSMAVVLSSLMPAKSQALLARAEDFAHSRIVCEQHWRHDIQAGQAYGTAIGIALLRNPAFRRDYEVAAAELRAAHPAAE